MNKYNDVYFSFEGWYWHIDDDIRDAWDRRFGEENVSIVLIDLREYLKIRPDFEETNIKKYFGGNWAFWIYNALERAEGWRKEKECQ